MKKNALFLTFIFLINNCVNAQCSWLRSKYDEIAFSRMLKCELKLAEKAKGDTVYVICFNATVHNSDKVFPHVLWYHEGDSIVAYKIKPFHKRKYIIQDTATTYRLDNIQHLDCNHGGWDLLYIYMHGKWVKSVVIDQECILEGLAENELGTRLQCDIVLLRENIPGWMSHPPATRDSESATVTK